jgi:hypothetical protein
MKQIYVHIGVFVQSIALVLATTPIAYALDPSILVVREDLLPRSSSDEVRVAHKEAFQHADLSFVAHESVVDDVKNIAIVVDPHHVAINTVSVRVHYDPQMLEFVGIDDKTSAFALSFVEYHDVENGVLVMHYFQPFPGVSEVSEVTKVMFRQNQAGTTTVSFGEKTAVLANDGFGTDVLADAVPLSFEM